MHRPLCPPTQGLTRPTANDTCLQPNQILSPRFVRFNVTAGY